MRHVLLMGIALALGGCSSSHGAGDDAGSGCAEVLGGIGVINCPGAIYSPGDMVDLQVGHGVGTCCASGEGDVAVSSDGPGEWGLVSVWSDVCDCCAECDCLGPSTSTTVTVGPLVAGANVVRSASGAAICELFAQEATDCSYGGTALAARYLFTDQTDDVTIERMLLYSCFCDPRVIEMDGNVDIGICDCQDTCGDGMADYVVHHQGITRPAGEYERELGSRPAPLGVFERASCRPIDAQEIRVRPPPTGVTYRSDGDGLWWLAVVGEELLCCAEPILVASSEIGADGAIDVTLYSCVEDDCACVPEEPTRSAAFHSLGPLPAGTYTARSGSVEETFVVD